MNGLKGFKGFPSTHGQSKSPTYRGWGRIKDRCLNVANKRYADYGGRGILICDRWLKFENFFADMGTRPAGASIDRINNDGNYEPGNCRWADRFQQQNNTRRNRMITAFGRTQTMAEWEHDLNLRNSTIHYRLKRGWSIEEALISGRTRDPHKRKLKRDQNAQIVREVQS